VPRENVEILLEASNAASTAETPEERATFFEILDPEVEWIAGDGAPDTEGKYHGIEGARTYYARWASAWEEWNWEIEEARADGDLVVTRTRATGRGRGSGLSLDMRIGQIWTFREGKVVRYQSLPSWEEALLTAGLVVPKS
jgi:ketosteroid isomerase-like protein